MAFSRGKKVYLLCSILAAVNIIIFSHSDILHLKPKMKSVHCIPKTELNEQATPFQKVQARREGGTTGVLAPSTGPRKLKRAFKKSLKRLHSSIGIVRWLTSFTGKHFNSWSVTLAAAIFLLGIQVEKMQEPYIWRGKNQWNESNLIEWLRNSEYLQAWSRLPVRFTNSFCSSSCVKRRRGASDRF